MTHILITVELYNQTVIEAQERKADLYTLLAAKFYEVDEAKVTRRMQQSVKEAVLTRQYGLNQNNKGT